MESGWVFYFYSRLRIAVDCSSREGQWSMQTASLKLMSSAKMALSSQFFFVTLKFDSLNPHIPFSEPPHSIL